MKINDVNVRLNTAWVNYNCGVRMAGRLRLEEGADTATWSALTYASLAKVKSSLAENTVSLIKEMFDGISDGHLMPALKGEAGFMNPIFPNDTGHYVPTAILVADDIVKMGQNPLYEWAALVKELKSHPDVYGVVVDSGPLFNNATYGSAPHFSRVWQLTIPRYTKYLLRSWKGGKPSRSQCDNYGYTKAHLGAEYEEIKEFFASAASAA